MLIKKSRSQEVKKKKKEKGGREGQGREEKRDKREMKRGKLTFLGHQNAPLYFSNL